MGNVPISCCRSRSPRLQNDSSSYRNGSKCQYSSTGDDLVQERKFSNKTRQGQEFENENQPSHILQHISEREPDDSETDPSSNPSNRPIFASRSTSIKNKTANIYNDSYSSNNSNSRRQNTPLMSSQDHGYNSNTSTNLTQYDGHLNDSFDSSIQCHQQAVYNHNESILNDNKILNDNRLLLSNSPSCSEDNNQSSLSVGRFDTSDDTRRSGFSNYGNLMKSSSCSTMYIDGSTISQPKLKQTIKCVSLAIYYHIKNRTSDCCEPIFDETIHPLKIPTSSSNKQDELIILDQGDKSSSDPEEPDQRTIYRFVKTLFKAAQLTSEYAITTLVYLERLMTYAEMDLSPKTWRRMFLGAILLSSKVWEDQAVWNVDYAQILEEISVEDINELERQFLELIQFNMNVPSSVYAKYYFHLRTLAMKNGLSQEYSLLTVGEAKTLEVSLKYLPI